MRAGAVRELAVSFHSGSNVLAGTLFLPGTGKQTPAVVIFHGSGPEPRNRMMGRWFAEHDVAALTYDKRGVGDSTGDFRPGPFMDLCDDGLAAIDLLKRRPDVDANRIGVWGLSQGGWLGPLAASRSKDVKFVIAVSGPGVSPGEQMIFYYANQLRHQGVSEAGVEEASALRRAVWHYLSTRDGRDVAKAALDGAASKPWFDALKSQSDGLFEMAPSKILDDAAVSGRAWFRSEMNYDPTEALRKLSVPALFLFGEKDELVPVDRSVAIIQSTLEAAGRHDFAIRVFPGADHTIRLIDSDGSRTFAPGYFDAMARWLKRTLTNEF